MPRVYKILTSTIMGPSIGESAQLVIPNSDPPQLMTDFQDTLRVLIINSKDLIIRALLSRFVTSVVKDSSTPAFRLGERNMMNETLPMSYIVSNNNDQVSKLIFTYHPDLANALIDLPKGMVIINKAKNPQDARLLQPQVIGEYSSNPEEYTPRSSHKILLRVIENDTIVMKPCCLDPIIRDVSAICWNRTPRSVGDGVCRAYVVWHAEFMLVIGVKRTTNINDGGIECWIVLNPRASHILVPFKDAENTRYRRPGGLHQNIVTPNTASYISVATSWISKK